MKKILALGLALLLALTLLTACGKKEGNNNSGNSNNTGNSETVYTIANFYDTEGGLSALGLDLGEENGEKVLTVEAGDTIIVGEHEYTVTAETLTLSFYTQPSFDAVIQWWMDYCESRVERGEMMEKANR